MPSYALMTALLVAVPAVLIGLAVLLWRMRSAQAGNSNPSSSTPAKRGLGVTILDEMRDGVLLADRRGQLVYMNRAARRDLNLETAELPAPLAKVLFSRAGLIELLSGQGGAAESKSQIDLIDDTSRRSYEVKLTELCDSRGRVANRLLVLRDVTDRRSAEEQLRCSEEGLRLILDRLPHLISVRDRDGRFLLANRACASAYRMEPDELLGRTIFDVDVAPEWVERMRESDRRVIDEGTEQHSQIHVTRGGHERVLEHTKLPFRFPAGGQKAVLGISFDVTERIRAEERIRALAFYDSLTGLPNRRRFQRLLGRTLERARRNDGRLALLFLDLDRFKEVNDRHGHSSGDHLLRDVAERLRDSVRPTDELAYSHQSDDPGASEEANGKSGVGGVASAGSDPESIQDALEPVARLAGDEFTILLADVIEPINAAVVANRIVEAMSRPFFIGSHEVFITASIGIALYPDDGLGPDALLRCADQAMYDAKRTGPNRYAFFDASMNAVAARRNDIKVNLRRAIEAGEFRLVYHQIRNAVSGQISGSEALLRWESAELGSVPPDEFIPVAEQTGFIAEIGLWVLREACRQQQQWHEEGLLPPRIAINVSAAQLQLPEFVDDARTIIENAGISLDEIEFELTETAILAQDKQTDETLRQLSELGVRLSLDDFGTGQSSLSYLRRFAFCRIKIDRSFISEIPDNRDDANLTDAIIAMAHGLRLSVVAEGVETEEQLQFLREHKCDELQGFLFAEPQTPEEFASHLERAKPSDPDTAL